MLIVDDDPFNLVALSILLKQLHLSCEKASNGLEAYEKVVNEFEQHSVNSLLILQGYKLIFMDYQMPVMDGCESSAKILRFLKQNGQKSPHIVACTAFTSMQDQRKCFSSGMCDFISKPLNQSIVKKICEMYL